MQTRRALVFSTLKWKKAVNKMSDKKATDHDVPGDVLNLLWEDGLKIMTQLISSMHETCEWPKYFITVTMITTETKTKATKCEFRRRTGNTDSTGLLRIISERTWTNMKNCVLAVWTGRRRLTMQSGPNYKSCSFRGDNIQYSSLELFD